MGLIKCSCCSSQPISSLPPSMCSSHVTAFWLLKNAKLAVVSGTVSCPECFLLGSSFRSQHQSNHLREEFPGHSLQVTHSPNIATSWKHHYLTRSEIINSFFFATKTRELQKECVFTFFSPSIASIWDSVWHVTDRCMLNICVIT